MGRRQARALSEAAQVAMAWIERWPGCVSAAVSRPLRFRFEAAVQDSKPSEAMAAVMVNDVVQVGVAVEPSALDLPAGLLRRHILDQVLAGIEQAARVSPNVPPSEVWIESRPVPARDAEPHELLGTEMVMLPEDEVLVIRRLDHAGVPALQRYHDLDDAFVDHLNNLGFGELQDTSTAANTVAWTVALR